MSKIVSSDKTSATARSFLELDILDGVFCQLHMIQLQRFICHWTCQKQFSYLSETFMKKLVGEKFSDLHRKFFK
jgi:hypothetical protein